jgi:hypothetical protein
MLSNFEILNSTFYESTSFSLQHIIYLSNGSIYNSSFSNLPNVNLGVVDLSYLKIEDSTFSNMKGFRTYEARIEVHRSSFTSMIGSQIAKAGTFELINSNSFFINSSFINCSSSKGGAIQYRCDIANCSMHV